MKGYVLIAAVDLRSDGSDFQRGEKRGAGHQNITPASGAIVETYRSFTG